MTPSDSSQTFLLEAEELLIEIESAALALTREHSNTDAINRLFRAFHTMKGTGDIFGFGQLVSFTHHIETMLGQVRSGLVPVNEQLTTLVLAAADQIRFLLLAAPGADAADAELQADLQALLLESLSQITEPPEVLRSARQRGAQNSKSLPVWHIEFHPDSAFLANGGSPFLLFRDLKKLGTCAIKGQTDTLPLIDQLEPKICYLRWDIHLTSACSESDIRDVFMFAIDGSELIIEAPEGMLSHADGQNAADLASEQALDHSSGGHARDAGIRVPAARLDHLVTLVGELSTNQSRLLHIAASFQSPDLAAPVKEIGRLVSSLRDDILQIRMTAIGSIFRRFPRLVRDLSLQLGKEIDFVTEGEDTELDRSIVDQLADPLTHLLRNSIGHGIETAADRLARGKSRRGTIRLSAAHQGSHVVITVEDDGRGLNRGAIRAKAMSQQLISADAVLSDSELLNLILLPGLSTAQAITSVSGRGVGMDVVKSQLDCLGGTLHISSEPSKGTTISLSIPLSVPVTDGLLLEVGDSQYIVPTGNVSGSFEVNGSDFQFSADSMPLVALRECFNLSGNAPKVSRAVIVQHEDKRVALVVDRVMGTHQTVQFLGRFFSDIGIVSGSTVMNDGRIALILDIPGVIAYADQHRRDPIAA